MFPNNAKKILLMIFGTPYAVLKKCFCLMFNSINLKQNILLSLFLLLLIPFPVIIKCCAVLLNDGIRKAESRREQYLIQIRYRLHNTSYCAFNICDIHYSQLFYHLVIYKMSAFHHHTRMGIVCLAQP